jgi:hypothetical protein
MLPSHETAYMFSPKEQLFFAVWDSLHKHLHASMPWVPFMQLQGKVEPLPAVIASNLY